MARGRRRPLWGWNIPARRLVAVVVILLATNLAVSTYRRARKGPAPDPVFLVDPNTAPSWVLIGLPRVGRVIAGRIVDERQVRPFSTLGDLELRVRGIGPAVAEILRPHLRFDRDGAPAVPDPVPRLASHPERSDR
jgi:hypothetical protein